jgi:CheY-like chemotaxis protein
MNAESLHGRRILVVEDTALIQFLAEQMLLSFGCRVIGPASGLRDAVPIATAQSFDAALLDINLANDEKSYPVADILASRQVPFAFVSAYGPKSLPARHRDAPLLEKPYSEAMLRQIIVDLLKPATASMR